MNPRLERKLRTFAVVVASGAIAGVAFNVPQGRLASVGVAYGMLMSAVLGATELFVLAAKSATSSARSSSMAM